VTKGRLAGALGRGKKKLVQKKDTHLDNGLGGRRGLGLLGLGADDRDAARGGGRGRRAARGEGRAGSSAESESHFVEEKKEFRGRRLEGNGRRRKERFVSQTVVAELINFSLFFRKRKKKGTSDLSC